MGQAVNENNVPNLLKVIWEDDLEPYMLEDEVLFGKMDKDTSFEGDGRKVVLQIGSGGGHSADFDKAMENRGAPTLKRFEYDVADDYAVWSVDKKLISRSRSNKGALKKALQLATQNAADKLKRRTVRTIWHNGGGAIGKIATAGVSTKYATLDQSIDIRNVDIGDVHCFAADDGYTASAGVLDGTRRVVDVDWDNGKIEYDTTLATIPGIGTGSKFIFVDGDYGAVSKGVPYYIPTSAPGTDSIPTTVWDMTRGTTYFTSGSRFTGDENQIAEEILRVLTEGFKRNVITTDIFMDPDLFNEFANSLEGQRVRTAEERVGKVGYTGIEVVSQNGKTVKCWGDPSIRRAPDGKRLVWFLNLDYWTFVTMEQFPMWLTDDKSKSESFMTEANANAVQGRLGGYPQVICNNFSQQMLLKLDA